jgi:hypothetical protein
VHSGIEQLRDIRKTVPRRGVVNRQIGWHGIQCVGKLLETPAFWNVQSRAPVREGLVTGVHEADELDIAARRQHGPPGGAKPSHTH